METGEDKAMLLQGSIQRFNLASILQFLAQNSATGVLEVYDFEEYGFIYLVDGRVEGISLPISDEKLGTRLVKAGGLSEQQLAEVLLEESRFTHEQKRTKPLGQRLIEKGFTSEAMVREVMRQQTLDQVFELAQWHNGVFAYDETEQMPHFQVAIQSNVQELLLDAQRRIDEGELSRKSVNAPAEVLCYGCPVEDECTPAIKAKHLKRDVCLWREMGAVLESDYDALRDARQRYRPADGNSTPVLDASIDW